MILHSLYYVCESIIVNVINLTKNCQSTWGMFGTLLHHPFMETIIVNVAIVKKYRTI